MSLIDDALKRAQSAGEGEAVRPTSRPWIPTPLPDPGIAWRRALLRWLGTGAAIAIVAAAAVWLLRNELSPGRHPLPAGEGRGQGRPAAAAVPQSTPTPDAVALATPIVVEPRTTRPPRAEAAGPLESAAPVQPTAPPHAPQAIANGKTYSGAVNLPGGARIELGGIVWSETEPRALLNDRIAAVGAYIEGFSLTKIEENRVALERDGVTIYISVK